MFASEKNNKYNYHRYIDEFLKRLVIRKNWDYSIISITIGTNGLKQVILK